jgi:hypothetical protein
MEEHPDRQPGSAITVHRRDDDDGGANQNFEGDWIDVGSSLVETLFVQSNSACAQSLSIQTAVVNIHQAAEHDQS